MTDRQQVGSAARHKAAARRAAALAAAAGMLAALGAGSGVWPARGAGVSHAMAASAVALACVPPAKIDAGPGPGGRDHRTGSAADGSAKYSAAVRAAVFPKGAPVDVSLSVRNTGAAAATWSFATAQRFDAVLYDDGCREVWRWSRGRMFAQEIGTLTIAPGEIVTYRVRWNQRDQQGRQVRPGTYEARVAFLGQRASGAGPVPIAPLEFAVR